ncbi:VCBS repeat-containing protein [Pirellulales bacterium]|nr:VCBS repeat-containing protein [Pirellulales bacterium]
MDMPDFMSTDTRNTTFVRQFVGRIVLISSSVVLLVTACRESPVSDARVPPASDAPVSERHTQSSTLDTLAPSSTAPSLQVVSHVATPLLEKRLAARNKLVDPHRDGWDSEVRAELAGQQLDEIATAVTKGAKANELENIDWVDPAFTGGDLYSVGGEVVFQSPQLEVKRPHIVATRDGQGKSRFSEAFTTMAEWFPSGATARAHVKTIGVTSGNTTTSTKHIVSFFWSHEQGSASYLATWTCDWKEVANELLLLAIRATDVEEVRYTDSADGRGAWFQDDTATVFADCPSYHAQLVPGLNHWLRRIDVSHGMYIFAEYGFAVGDVNGDQRDDLYVCQPAGLPNRLYLQREDGSVQDVSEQSGANWMDQTSSALLIDLDNDGDQDLALAIEARRILVMENDGRGRYKLKKSLPIEDRNVKGLSAADYDSDGDLDLYLTIAFADERARQEEYRPEFLYHDANNGGANILFQNNISATAWTFTDVTRQSGLDYHNRRHSLAAAWEDFDDDGDQDLYVANDYGQNCLYRNDGGKFQDIADTSGTVDYGGGMSVDWSDYDRDGRIDLYVANMFSSAGRRITVQQRFRQEMGEQIGNILTRFAKGNTLLQNLGDGQFREVGHEARVEHGRWAWASIFGDWNNDGWDDLYVANGYVTNDDTKDL